MHRWSGVLGLQQVVYVDRMPGREGICSTLLIARGLRVGKYCSKANIYMSCIKFVQVRCMVPLLALL